MTESVLRLLTQKAISHIALTWVIKSSQVYDKSHFHILCVIKGFIAQNGFSSQLGLSSPQRPGKSGAGGWPASRMCGVEEEVRAGSLEAWWCVSDQSNAVPKRAETLGCCKICAERCKCLISWLSFLSPSVHLLLSSSLLVCLTLFVKLQHVIPSFAYKTNCQISCYCKNIGFKNLYYRFTQNITFT